MIKIIEIDNLEMPELQPFTHLNENQLKHYWEPYGGLFIGESPNVILRALDAGYEPVVVLMEKRFLDEYYRNRRRSGQYNEEPVGVEKNADGADVLIRLQDWRGRKTCGAVSLSAAAEGGEGRPDDENSVPVYVSTIDVLSQITGYHLTRGILCAFRRKRLPSVEEVCRSAHRVVVLENVENPTNVGAIFRSAAALGMDAVLLTPECADPLYRRAVRVSVGTVFQIPWTYIGVPERHYTWMKSGRYQKFAAEGTGDVFPGNTDIHADPSVDGERVTEDRSAGTEKAGKRDYGKTDWRTRSDDEAVEETGLPARGDGGNAVETWPARGMQELRAMGFHTAAMALRDDTVSPDDPVLRREKKLALILGNEGEGLLPQTIEQCDYTIRIPMAHGVDSLNVAAASAVAFWELGKPGQRD